MRTPLRIEESAESSPWTGLLLFLSFMAALLWATRGPDPLIQFRRSGMELDAALTRLEEDQKRIEREIDLLEAQIRVLQAQRMGQ